MSESHPPSPHALLQSTSTPSPNFRSHKPLRRRRDDRRGEGEAPLASPDAVSGTDTGLPPTPPSNSQDAIIPKENDFDPPPRADGVVSSLLSKRSNLSTPINQRSPPTPDPSPPRNHASMSQPLTTPERPILFAYPSSASRADSFKTAREDPSTTEENSRSTTPSDERLGPVGEDRGLGLAFERDDSDATPRATMVQILPENEASASMSTSTSTSVDIDEDSKDAPDGGHVPNQEWDTKLMRNVTLRRKRKPKPSPSASPQKNPDRTPPASPRTASTPRRSTSLRERVEASKNSPTTPAIETFAKQIGWPMDGGKTPVHTPGDADQKRLSTSSMASTVVEAMVIVTPPQRRRTLRHTGKNLSSPRHASSPVDLPSRSHSGRTSSARSEDVPLHRLVHKRVSINDRSNRLSADASSLGGTSVSATSIARQRQECAAATLAHQESVRRILQPAADILSRSNSLRRVQGKNYHQRTSSAPEPSSPSLRTFPLTSTDNLVHPPQRNVPSRLSHYEIASPTSTHFEEASPMPVSSSETLPVTHRSKTPQTPANTNKSLPEIPLELPVQSNDKLEPPLHDLVLQDNQTEEIRPSSTLLERVRVLLADNKNSTANGGVSQQSEVPQQQQQQQQQQQHVSSPTEPAPIIRRGSLSIREQSEEQWRSSQSQDRTSTSRDAHRRPSLDRRSTEDVPRTPHEWRSLHTDEHGRLSFDRMSSRTEEHAMARHAFAQTTPFSQFSDTPIEVSEATAVTIFPHNNHSLLVVQQLSRASAQQPHVIEEVSSPQEEEVPPPTPPFHDANESFHTQFTQPTLTFESSTPPMQIELPPPEGVDSPLRNPRPPPEPPVIKFIPPTPAEELERELPPGPPAHSNSHPQRRLSLKQRARRYSDNFISPIFARASHSIRSRRVSESHTGHHHPQIPTVNDNDNALHPFWRPRGFWDGFEDSDSESDDGVLPRGGDTSDVEDSDHESATPRRRGTLGRRLTQLRRDSGGGVGGGGRDRNGGFLIGNSLGVSRSGTNRRRPQITLPSRRLPPMRPLPRLRRKASSPKVIIQPPTQPLGAHSQRIDKGISRNSLQSSSSGSPNSFERRMRERGERWRRGKRIPGFKGYQVQYIGLSGVKDRIRERKAEKRREELRKSIGGRWYVEPGMPGGGVS